MAHLHDRFIAAFRAVALALFHFDALVRALRFDAEEVNHERVDLFQAVGRFHVVRPAARLVDVTRDLEVVLLLTNERLVRVGVIKAFVSVDLEVGRLPVGGARHSQRSAAPPATTAAPRRHSRRAQGS